MIKCPGCGEENPPKFKLCGYCGTPLAGAAPVATLPAHEIRKTVTIVFTDLKDSTALGETLDSEALHEVKERYFNAMSAEIKRHGGKIEKYIGDAIMAVFGLPRAHEDDALRAVRAAAGMQDGAARGQRRARRALRRAARQPHRRQHRRGRRLRRPDRGPEARHRRRGQRHGTARGSRAREPDLHRRGHLAAREGRRRGRGGRAADAQGQVAAGAGLPAAQVCTANTATCGVTTRRWSGARRSSRRLQTAFDEAVDAPARPHGDGDRRRGRRQVQAGARVHGARAERARASSCGRCLPYGDGITFWPLREMVVSAAGIRQDDPPEHGAREARCDASAMPTWPSASPLQRVSIRRRSRSTRSTGRRARSWSALPPRRRSWRWWTTSTGRSRHSSTC